MSMITTEKEMSVYECMAARFDVAAQKLNAIADPRAIDANSTKILNAFFAMNCFGDCNGCCAFANTIRSDKEISVVQPRGGQGGSQNCKLLCMSNNFSEAHLKIPGRQ